MDMHTLQCLWKISNEMHIMIKKGTMKTQEIDFIIAELF